MLYALGRLIAQQRRARGLTQGDYAAIVGIARITLQSYEAGRLGPPFDTLIRLANACDMTLSMWLSPLDSFEVPLREVRRRTA